MLAVPESTRWAFGPADGTAAALGEDPDPFANGRAMRATTSLMSAVPARRSEGRGNRGCAAATAGEAVKGAISGGALEG